MELRERRRAGLASERQESAQHPQEQRDLEEPMRITSANFDTFLKRDWAQGASNIHRRKHSDDCGAAVGKHALVVFTGTADFKCDACHKEFMASSSTSLNHLAGM